MRQTTCEQIMETETPLDVLSRAASLVDTNEVSDNSSSCISNKPMSIQDNEVSSLKLVLPIKALKQRRKKRRDQDYFYTRLRARRTASTQTSVSLMTEGSAQEKNNGVSLAHCKEVYEYDDSYDEQDSDTPLDMTVRNRKPVEEECKESCSPEEETLTKCLVSSQPNLRSSLQQRPSVITCASTIQQTALRTVNFTCSNNFLKNNTSPETRHGHRREVFSGMCDPVIDEHFRRSLGKDYPEFFSNLPKSSTVSVCTVDDHFSKALGDTWLQLKEKSYSSNSPSTTSRPTELSQTSTSPLLQQC